MTTDERRHTWSDAPEHRKGTCETCGASRKLGLREKYHWRCRECWDLTGAELEAKRAEGEARREARNAAGRLAYPCVGGPLHGEFAQSDDFYDGRGQGVEGMYHHLRGQYHEYNSAAGRGKSTTGFPSMIWVHTSFLPSARAPRDR